MQIKMKRAGSKRYKTAITAEKIKWCMYILAMTVCFAVNTLILTHSMHLLCMGEKMKTIIIVKASSTFNLPFIWQLV